MVDHNFSIIIPAYNESALIAGTLAYLIGDRYLKNIEIIVVCNGCIDQTAEKVRLFNVEYSSLLLANNISIVTYETDKASKTNALNIGVRQSRYDINLFLDADILINGQDLQKLVSDLNDKKLKAMSPSIVFDFTHSSFLVRQYYKVASQSYYNIDYRLSNVIALSASAIDKVGSLPEVIADDDYIRRLFSPHEIAVSKKCVYQFICAKTFVSLLQVLTRVERGNIQLASKHVEFEQTKRPMGYYNLPKVAFLFFVIIRLFVKVRAKIQILLGNTEQWERDESNRKL